MCSKCANPDCSTAFNYRQGRIFRFHRPAESGDSPAKHHSIRHFWLCNSCSEMYTLKYLGDRGVLIAYRFMPEQCNNGSAEVRAKSKPKGLGAT